MPNNQEQRDIKIRTHFRPAPRSNRKISLRWDGLSLTRAPFA